jgi:hypothetical protein
MKQSQRKKRNRKKESQKEQRAELFPTDFAASSGSRKGVEALRGKMQHTSVASASPHGLVKI